MGTGLDWTGLDWAIIYGANGSGDLDGVWYGIGDWTVGTMDRWGLRTDGTVDRWGPNGEQLGTVDRAMVQ